MICTTSLVLYYLYTLIFPPAPTPIYTRPNTLKNQSTNCLIHSFAMARFTSTACVLYSANTHKDDVYPFFFLTIRKKKPLLPSSNRPPSLHPPSVLSRKAKLWNLAHLAITLRPADLVRRSPPQLDALDPGGAVARVPDADVLCDAAALLRGEGAACLGSELELVALLSR